MAEYANSGIAAGSRTRDCGFDSHLGYLMGCWSKGRPPGLQPGDRGSTPRRSTDNAMLALVVKLDITPRFEREVPGSTPGRGTGWRMVDDVTRSHAPESRSSTI